MKILEHGKIPEKIVPWPIGYHFICNQCHCRFQIEDGDTFRQKTEKMPGCDSQIWIACPDCTITLNFYRHSEASRKPMWAIG